MCKIKTCYLPSYLPGGKRLGRPQRKPVCSMMESMTWQYDQAVPSLWREEGFYEWRPYKFLQRINWHKNCNASPTRKGYQARQLVCIVSMDLGNQNLYFAFYQLKLIKGAFQIGLAISAVEVQWSPICFCPLWNQIQDKGKSSPFQFIIMTEQSICAVTSEEKHNKRIRMKH